MTRNVGEHVFFVLFFFYKYFLIKIIIYQISYCILSRLFVEKKHVHQSEENIQLQLKLRYYWYRYQHFLKDRLPVSLEAVAKC